MSEAQKTQVVPVVGDTILALLPYVLPPLLGAIIGYLTNAIAIKMLFRPLTEIRVLGLRLPFTPGIIPRQRYQLSSSIASMVSTKLLTPDLVQSRIDDPSFTTSLTESVSRFTSDLLHSRPETSPEEGQSPMPTADNVDQKEAGENLVDIAGALLHGFFSSGEFSGMVRRILGSVVDGALAMRLGEVAPHSDRLRELAENLLSYLSGDKPTAVIVDLIARWLDEQLESDVPMKELVGERTIGRLRSLVPTAYDPLLDVLLTFLRHEHTRKELSVHGRDLLKQILKRLTVFQRLLVSATQYDRNLNENMPGIVDDVIKSIEKAGKNAENRDAIIGEIDSRIESLGDTGIRTLSDELSLDLHELAERAVAAVKDFLARESTRTGAADTVVRFVDRRRDDTIGEIIEAASRMDAQELRTRLTGIVDNWLEQPGTPERLTHGVTELIERFVQGTDRRPLAELLPINDEQKARIDRFIARKIRDQIGARVPELVEGLDLHRMVVEKIDGLDIESVEQLLLMVIAKHLKWINLFGALLGALIGGTQVVVGLVT